jgi:hypothetical protein
VGKTERPLSAQIQEHRRDLREGLMEKSKHAYEGHSIGWEEAEILQTETNNGYRKLKEASIWLVREIRSAT